jgi:hypothetical protein
MALTTKRHPRIDDDARRVAAKLDEWVTEGLLTRAQADAIVQHESRRPAVAQVPLAAEAVGYIGAALVVAAVGRTVGRNWDDLSTLARLAVLVVPTVFVTVTGEFAGRRPEHAAARLGSVLWLLACAGTAGALAVVFADVFFGGDPPSHGQMLFVASGTAVAAAALWWRRRLPLQQLALFATTMCVGLGVVDALEGALDRSFSTLVWGAAAWVVGLAWLAAGRTGRVAPTTQARVVGAVTMLYAAQVVAADAHTSGIWLGMATAIGLLVVGVAASAALELLIGTAGIFQWTPQLAYHYLADAIGAEASLFVAGVVLLGVAFLLLRRFSRGGGA